MPRRAFFDCEAPERWFQVVAPEVIHPRGDPSGKIRSTHGIPPRTWTHRLRRAFRLRRWPPKGTRWEKIRSGSDDGPVQSAHGRPGAVERMLGEWVAGGGRFVQIDAQAGLLVRPEHAIASFGTAREDLAG